MSRGRAPSLFGFLDRAEKWTGGKELACREPGCPLCGTPLVAATVEQAALFIHGGYGATQRTTWVLCPNDDCRWSLEHLVEEVRPERGRRAG